MKKLIVIMPVIAAVVFAACNPATQTNTNQSQPELDTAQTNLASPTTDPENVDTATGTDTFAPSQASAYSDYSQSAALAAAESGTSVLFFHASWCPTCRVADQELSQNTDQLPAGVRVFKVDFDSETDLKQQYGVTSQHTFVQIDADGNEITKWNGGGLDDIIDNIQT